MITITGSNSFIGKNFINFLNQKKIKNSFLLRKKIKSSRNKSNYYKFSKEQKKQTDILIHISSASLALLYRKKKFTKQEVLFCIENELDNLLSLIDFYKKNNIKKFILISSSSLYGKSKFKKPFNEKDKCNPKDYYSIIKLAVETVAQKICKNIIIIRPFQIYGKFDNPHRLIPTLFNSKKNRNINLQDCLQVTDILHVDDFCEAILKICKSKTKNGIFNVGSGRPIKLRTIVETIHKFRNKEFRFAYKKTKQNKINNYCYSDNSLIQKTFNWKPKISLVRGLKKL